MIMNVIATMAVVMIMTRVMLIILTRATQGTSMTFWIEAVGFVLTVMVIFKSAVLTKNFTLPVDASVVFDLEGMGLILAMLA